MILFVFHDRDRARYSGFENGKHRTDPELRCWYPDMGDDLLRGRTWGRIINCGVGLTERQQHLLRAYLRDAPMTWVNL